MTDWTHARCGGELVLIQAPDWWNKQPANFHSWQAEALFVRCQRCGLAGELA